MDPATGYLIGQAISAGLGALFGGSSSGQQVRTPFKNALDPTLTYAKGMQALSGLGQGLERRLKRPVRLRSAYVQSPPSFAGGGLPLPIGVTGQDPALRNPSLLELPGLVFNDNSIFRPLSPAIGGDQNQNQDNRGRQRSPRFPGDTGGQPGQPPGEGRPRRRSPQAGLVPPEDFSPLGPEDYQKAAGALQLLVGAAREQ